MAKNILQDIVPPEKRSIRNIPVPMRRGVSPQPPKTYPDVIQPQAELVHDDYARTYATPESHDAFSDNLDSLDPKVYSYDSFKNSFNGRYSKKGIWIACGLALVIVLVAFASLFSAAKVKVTPVTKSSESKDIVFSAYQGSDNSSGVPYEVVKISKDIGAPVTATGEENVSTKGSGTIIVYNTFSSASQRLIKNTRFETPEGLIYRINDSIVVPGQTTAGGKKVPGSIEVVVYADEAGDRYNIGLKDFTIPGFKGDPRFTAMYARSKTAMTGGFVGVMKKVAQADLGTAKSTLDSQLKEALSKEVSAQIPADYVVFPDAMLFAFENLPQSNPQGSTVQVNERGTLTALMFNKNKLAQYVASAVSSEFASSSSSISNLSSLGFAMQNKTSFNPALDSSFTFTLTGPVSFLSQVDTAKFASDIAGKPKSSLPSVLVNYPSIERAEVVLRPFWKRSFPSNPKDITIDVLNTQ